MHRWAAVGVWGIGASLLAGTFLIGAGPDTPTPRPFPLNTCAMLDRPLGATGRAIVRVVGGREARFCCEDCAASFEADRAHAWELVDARIIEEQRLHYPLTACIVTGEPLGRDDADDSVEFVCDNRLVRVADEDAQATFLDDAMGSSAKLDTAIADDQRAGYPLSTCVVGGEALGAAGEPFELVFANRLVRLCGEGCAESFHADPGSAMAVLDGAYADAQRADYPLTECVVCWMELGSMGRPVDLVAGTRLVRFCCKGCVRDFRADPQAYLKAFDER